MELGSTSLDRESEELVDRPLVVGVLAVAGGHHGAVGRDQEVAGQPVAAAAREQRRRSIGAAEGVKNYTLLYLLGGAFALVGAALIIFKVKSVR